MPLSDFASLLSDLAIAFGEEVIWRGGKFIGRFRIDPFTVPLPATEAGLNTTETWLYSEIAQIPRDDDGRLPDQQDEFSIRGWSWEIVEIGDDDLGERQFRLLRREPAPPYVPPDEPLPPGAESPPPPFEVATYQTEQARGPGRPSRREDIERAYEVVVTRAAPGTPLARLYGPIRREITGRDAPSPGLSDKTIAALCGPLYRRRARSSISQPL